MVFEGNKHTKECPVKNRIVMIAFLALVLLSPPVNVHAQTKPTPTAPIAQTRVIGKMTLDCVHMTDKGRQYADAHNLCPKGKIVPDGVSNGNCGTTYIFIQPVGGGSVTFHIGATSILGPITYIGWTVSFQNLRTNQFGSIAGGQSGFSTTYSIYTSSATYTNTGVLSAGLFGTVYIGGGYLTCYFTGATDFTGVY